MIYKHMPSFAGGEISPAMYGRTDFAKYDNGAAELTNFMVLRYGGITNRPGTRYVMTCPGYSVLRAFRYNAEENYILVFSAHKVQVCFKGKPVVNALGGVVTVDTPYEENELRLIKYTQSADVVFLAHPNHEPWTLTRYGHNDWRMEKMDIANGPFEDPNTDGTKITASGKTGSITLTASKNFFVQDMVGCLMRLGHTVGAQYKDGVPLAWTDSQGVEHAADNLTVSCVPGGSVHVESFGFWTGNFTLEKYYDGAWVKIRTQEGNHSQNYTFSETNKHDSIIQYRITSTEFDPKPWSSENERQTGKVSIQSFSNDYYGVVKINSITNATRATATVVNELGDTKATSDFSLAPWSPSKGYPYCAGFFEDRLVFAGTEKYGQSFWMSKSGDYYNFKTSIPSEDTDAVIATLNGGQMNGIKAVIAFGEMLMLTAGGEYKVSGNNNPISPSNVRSQAQEYRGISDVAPVTVGSRIIYVQQQGSIIRDLGYQYDVDKYTGDDLTLLADHLFRKHKIVSMAYQQAPNSIVWCVRDDGLLLGLTYIKEQDIYAWTKHTTYEGEFIDVACIAGEDEDELWCVVKRNGQYFVEVMAPRGKTDEVEEQYFVDCGVTYDGAATATITGLEHLEGYDVSILADGFVLPRQKVTNGEIVLMHPYSKVHVGLPIEALFKSLPVEINGQDGSYLSRKKRISKVMIMFLESRGGTYGLNEANMDEMKWRSTENWGEPIQLYTGKKEIIMPAASFGETLQIVVRQAEPLPLTVLSMVPEIGG